MILPKDYIEKNGLEYFKLHPIGTGPFKFVKHFPVRVDYLSRARKPKDVKRILEELKEGKIDIIIGTHKLIGKTVQFKDWYCRNTYCHCLFTGTS
jgi:hypothetical protein